MQSAVGERGSGRRRLYRFPIGWDTLMTFLLLAGSPVFAVWFTGFGLDTYRTWGLRPADGGVLKPYPERLGFLIVTAVFGWGLVIVMLVVGRRYVLTLSVDGSDTVHLRVLTYVLPTTVRFPVSSIQWSSRWDQRVRGTRSSWYLVRVEGRRFPFMMNRGWAKIGDEAALRAVLQFDDRPSPAGAARRRWANRASGPRLVYSAGWRAGVVLAAMVASAAIAVAMTWWAVDVYRTVGLRSSPGGLIPAPDQAVWPVVRILFGWSLLVGMLVLGRRYVTAVHVEDVRQTVHVRTFWFVVPTTRVVRTADVLGPRGDDPPPGPRSRPASFAKIRVRWQRLPYVIDLRGRVERPEALRRYLKIGR